MKLAITMPDGVRVEVDGTREECEMTWEACLPAMPLVSWEREMKQDERVADLSSVRRETIEECAEIARLAVSDCFAGTTSQIMCQRIERDLRDLVKP